MSLQSIQHNTTGDEEHLAKPQEGITYPLFYSQHCFWFVAAMLGSTANIYNCMQIDGEIQPALLEQAINELIAHHPTLRCAISLWRPTQRILPGCSFDLPFSDLTAVAPMAARQQIDALIQHFLSTPFDLQKPPLLRIHLFQLQPRLFVMVSCFPHIVADGAAMYLFCQQLWQRYRQLVEGSNTPFYVQNEIPFTTMIMQERSHYRQLGAKERAFWRNHLQGYSWATFPAHYINQTEVKTSISYFVFPAGSYEQLENIARERKASLQMVLLTLIGRVVHKMTGASRFALNSVLESREQPESESLMVSLMRVMPVPLDITSAATFSALLTQVRENVLRAYDHMDCPWSLPVGVMAEQRWRNSPRLFPLLIRATSRLYQVLCPRAALYPHFLADFLFMEPQPPQTLFRQPPRSVGIADPLININILQDAFRQNSTAGIEDFLQMHVWPQSEGDREQQGVSSWENDSVNIYLTRTAEGQPVLRIVCCCFTPDGITQFTDFLQQELNTVVGC